MEVHEINTWLILGTLFLLCLVGLGIGIYDTIKQKKENGSFGQHLHSTHAIQPHQRQELRSICQHKHPQRQYDKQKNIRSRL